MPTDGKTQVKTPQRKPYHAPVLHVYGGIEALTKSAGSSPNADGGTSGKNKKTS